MKLGLAESGWTNDWPSGKSTIATQISNFMSQFQNTQPICIFFQQGQCKFGARCRNRHVPVASTTTTPSFNEENIRQDLQLIQWPLSCYSPINTLYPPTNLFSDVSFEECRLEYYCAVHANQLPNYVP